MRRVNREQGFTLIEILIATAITAIVMIAGTAFIAKFARTSAAFAEGHELEESRGTVAGIFRSDFDGAGRNLTRSSPPGAGREMVVFLPVPDYRVDTPGTATRLTPETGAYPSTTSTRAVGAGGSVWEFTPSSPVCRNCWTTLYGSDGSGRSLAVDSLAPAPSAIVIYENGSYAATSFGVGVTIAPHIPGDTYQIRVELPTNTTTGNVLRYYRIRSGVRSLLYTSTNAVPAYPQYLAAYASDSGSAITNASVTAAPIVNRVENITDVAQMPMDGGVRLSGPVTIGSGGQSATILAGDSTIDAVSTITPFSSTDTDVTVKVPRRGSFITGDYVLLLDFAGADASAVCQVTNANTQANTVVLTLARVKESGKAWGRLWSSDAEHNHTFPQGSAIVRLAPPVTYAIAGDGRLVRMEGARTSTVAFNTRTLMFTEQTTVTGRSYAISATFAAEGFETNDSQAAETRATVEYLSTPRALNLGSNQLN
jgi:prepilin-type N-terminal cleavage/methylation domain-containing protein